MNTRDNNSRTRPGGSARKKWERAQIAKAQKRRAETKQERTSREMPEARTSTRGPANCFHGERSTHAGQGPCCTDREASNERILKALREAVWDKTWVEAKSRWELRPPAWLVKKHRRCFYHLPEEARKRLGLRR